MACGCAAFGAPTQKGYTEVLQTWVGEPASDLIARWGQPYKRNLVAGGTLSVLYMRESTDLADLQSGQPQADISLVGSVVLGQQLYEAAKRQHEFQSVLSAHRCLTLFSVDRGGIIRKIEFVGDACRAVPRRGTGPDSWSASAQQLVSPHALETGGPS